MNKEEAVSIPDHPDYKIDFNGNIEKNDGYIPKVHHMKRGYKVVRLNMKRYSIHRLVAETFIPNPNNMDLVDHINHDVADNNIHNLRWVDLKENAYNSRTNPRNRKYAYPKNIYPDRNNPDRYWVRIRVNGKTISVARNLESLITAIRIARRARLLLHGEYRCE